MTAPALVTHDQASRIAQQNGSEANARKYGQFSHQQGTTWLAFRDIPALFRRYVTGTKGIDFGSGAGRSTRFLSSLGLHPIGVDISPDMVTRAKEIDQQHNLQHTYHVITGANLPVAEKTCDFVFSSFVFFDISSKETMKQSLHELKRVLKDDGTIIIVTGNEKMHDPTRKWVSYHTDYPENYAPQKGAPIKIQIQATGAEFTDFHWEDEDYKEVFEASGLKVVEQLQPLGSPEDQQPWLDETTHSPYYIYTLKKA